ncbi:MULTISPECIES: ABC transporter permease DevC [unclassified Synechocystis]|uniref:ABC transporter permease DevC n=1 Tax=unclassified Synechocystis TaxID=2640012 RepID=UPI0004279EAC|nr:MULTISPECIES: ABC transporter permease DevC [unclassified Synechocystis]AIE72817.1 ABC transporter permease protein [Synechocystis sp. PCC 6714]MCT0254549.1 ABC transporter permease DevC [Synechocystis sp. CS-94]
MKIPLAWHQLFHERMRLLAAIAGIAFADVLIFMQLGFKNALFDSAIRIPESLQGDLFILSTQTDTFVNPTPFAARRLYQAMGNKAVNDGSSLYIDINRWKNPETKASRQIYIMGFNPVNNPINLPGVGENLDLIKRPDVFLFDQDSREEFGPVPALLAADGPVFTEVGNRRIQVQGLFTLGSSFGADGTLITSDLNFFRLFPDRDRTSIDVAILQLKPGADPERVAEEIRKDLTGGDVQIFTKEKLVQYELNYWQTRTTIGFVFGLGTAMGFIVGTVIVYQILYTDVSDHLPEYATLKAIGYGDRYLLGVVFQEALLLAVIGFLPSFGLGLILYTNTARATGLPLIMTTARALTVLIMTIAMCCISGAIAVGRLRAADPADIF